jgi:hypothetical protein
VTGREETRGRESAAPAVRCECERVPVLCGCGWGRVALPVCEVPEFCPVCGFGFWEMAGPPDACGQVRHVEVSR